MRRASLSLALFLALTMAPAASAQDTVTPVDTVSEADYLQMEGEGLSVVGAKKLNQQVRTVTRAEIELALAGDIPSLLEKVLSVSVNRNGAYGNQAGVSLRGSGGGRVAVLIDGVPVNSSQSGGFDLGKIPLDSVEKIEVIYGGSDTKYNFNGAVGGVINIITVQKKTQGISAALGLSNISYAPAPSPLSLADTQQANLDFSLGCEKVFWTLKLNGTRAGNEFQFTDPDGGKKNHSGNEVADGGASTALTFNLSENRKILLTSDLYSAQKNIPGPIGTLTSGKQKEKFTQTAAFLDAPNIGNERIASSLSLSHSWNSIDWKDSSIHSLHNLHTITAINRWSWAASDSLLLEAGGDIDFSLLSSSVIGEKRALNGGVYVTAELSEGKKILLVFSVKAVAVRNSFLPVPKFGIVYRVNDNLTIKNNYFRTFKLPTLNDLYWPSDAWAEGNPNLKSEDGFGADLVAEGKAPGAFTVNTSVYSTWQKDAILWQTAGGKWKPANIGEALYLGSDTSIKSTFSERVALTASYSFLMTWVLGEGLTLSDDRRLPYKPVHTLGTGISFYDKEGSLSISEHYESERFATTANVSRLGSFFTVDIHAEKQLDGEKTVVLAVNNLFNESWYSIEGYPMPGLSVTAALRIRFLR